MGVSGAGAVKIALGVDELKEMGFVRIDFNIRLQERGTDFKVYANKGYTRDPKDSALLVGVLERLTTTLPYSSMTITPFEVMVYVNRTSSREEVMAEAIAAARTLGYTVN